MDRPAFDSRALCSASAAVSASEPAARRPFATPAARHWRCLACGALLGVERDGELHVKYKEAQYWIRGHCRHACRRCGAMNTLHTPALPVLRAALAPQGDPR